ncbi:MAG TPA: 5-formyltetrahydrofolate cyclo-ligase [Candidatus Saccharimonadales bacterium]|nr:5-formyltetrahydrofolate cyclo-ligase [Candidatus Saccharimonadales bacterium]
MYSKAQLRAQLQAARQHLSAGDVKQKSQVILEQLKELVDWPHIGALHCYVPLIDAKEVDTRPLFEFAWRNYPQIAIYTAKKDGKLLRVHPGFELEHTKAAGFDVIIVPMLGFDERKHRLGYGGGYYDRLLAEQPRAQKIGLSFELGNVGRLPVEPHDKALDIVITETRVSP